MIRRLKLKVILLLLPIFSFLLRAYARTLRWENKDIAERHPNSIFAILHGQSLIMALYGRDKGIYSLSSQSDEGLISGRLQELMGFRVIYGYSELGRGKRGARSATMKLLKALKEGSSVGITVDGPLGPAFKVQRGVLYLSYRARKPIVPVVAKVSKAIVLKSWDRFTIPLPLSKVTLFEGEKVLVTGKEEIDRFAYVLENNLRNLYHSLSSFQQVNLQREGQMQS